MLNRSRLLRDASKQNQDLIKRATEAVKNYFVFNKDSSESLYSHDFRTPSPGSQEKANIPKVESEDDLYDIKKFTKAKVDDPYQISTPEKVYLVQPPSMEGFSPGDKNPDVLRYDPTGTRSAMTTTQEAMLAEQDKFRPNHLPLPWWTSDKESLEDEAKRKNLPFVFGRQSPWATSGAIYDYTSESK